MLMRRQRGAWLALFGLLAACGGGGGGGGGSTPLPPIAGTPTPTPPPAAAPCSLRARQDWVLAQLNEWYLFPNLLDTTVNPANHATVQSYIDALVAPARAQGRDRFFTFITSIAEENAFFQQGSSAGFGVRLGFDSAARRVFILDSYEGAPALAQGIDRGTEIIAIGTSTADLRTVDSIIAAEGNGGVSAALGPATAGVTRLLRVRAPGGATRDVTVTKAEFEIPPVSPRFGVQVINDNGSQVGYVNLRTFIGPADPALRNAFSTLRAQGITNVIVDFRYNGGGLVSIAELLTNLLGGNRSTNEVLSFTTFRASKAANNETEFFNPQPQSIAPMRIAFIGTGSTASASELVINSLIPYYGNRLALIGSNTFGKPVGQIALDRAQCDDRLRVLAFQTQNSQQRGEYFNGLLSEVQASCAAPDDFLRQMGDPNEASTRAALDFLAGRSCTPITSLTARTQSADRSFGQRVAAEMSPVMPDEPTPAQREIPGLH
jgi:carboxyl-terminal processing protease